MVSFIDLRDTDMTTIHPPEKLEALLKMLWYIIEKELTEEQKKRINEQMKGAGIV